VKLIECVPNFSDGRNPDTIAAIRDAVAAVDGITVLHVTSDASHNRSVITFVGPAETIGDAAVAAIRTASERIDLTAHAGVHPRMGAADVVPFIPLDGATMDDCVAIARDVGARVGALGIPVYLYEHAATHPDRRNLAHVRRGGFEAIRADLAAGTRAPDFGPAHIHPTAGAVAVGARPFLIAFNVYIGDAAQLGTAKAIAKAVRESDGGLPAVKALGLEVDGQAQVSMNLVDLGRTSLATAYAAVQREAEARGARVTWSEIIGLVPERALDELATEQLRLRDDAAEHVLERRLRAARPSAPTVAAWIDAVAAVTPTPGGGSVAAHVGAVSAALCAMVAGLTLARDAHAASHPAMRAVHEEAHALMGTLRTLADRDAVAYRAVLQAYRHPKDAARDGMITAALLEATRVPLDTARACARVAELAWDVAEHGTPRAITDAASAALLAEAACRAALYNVRTNLAALPREHAPLLDDAESARDRATAAALRVVARTDALLAAPR